MTANIIWNATNARVGTPRGPEPGPRRGGAAGRYLLLGVGQPGEVQATDPAPGAEGERESEEHPGDADDPDGREALHDHAEDVLLPDHAAVEEGDPRGHQQYQRRTREQPGGGPGIQLGLGKIQLHALLATLRAGGRDGWLSP